MWFDRICTNHPDMVNNLSREEIISAALVEEREPRLRDADVDIFSLENSKLNTIIPGT